MTLEHLLKIENWKLKILLAFLFSLLIFNFLPNEAEAGLIIQRPLYIGLTDGLVGYWSFDGPDMSGNTAYDRSGQSNNGTLTNGPVRRAGRIGQALEFDGSDDLVNAGSGTSLDDLGPMTASAWIYPRSGGQSNSGAIVIKGDAAGFWEFRFTTTNTIRLIKDFATTDLDRIASNNSITFNTWQHVLMTWDGSATAANVHIYINGIETSYSATTDGVGAKNSDAALNLALGNRVFGGVAFDGLIDDVRIYNRVLSTDEIKRLYKIGSTLLLNKPAYTDSLQNGLVGFWSFDGQDISGVTAYDRSGQGNNGTLTNGPVRRIGRIGQALEFDGSNDYVNAGSGSSLDDLGSFSASAWIYPRSDTGAGGAAYIVMKGSWGLRIRPTRALDFVECRFSGACGYRISSNNVFTLNNWNHVFATWDGSVLASNMHTYVNGVEVTYTTAVDDSGTPISDAALNFTIGSNSAFNQSYNGLIDEVRVYNRVLSADEIKRLYKIGSTLLLNKPAYTDSLQNGLVGFWSFDGPDMAGNTAYDRSGQNNNGTLTNGPVRRIGRIGQALDFDGVNNYVGIGSPSSLNLPGVMSVFAWIKSDDTSFTHVLDGQGGTFGVAGQYAMDLGRTANAITVLWAGTIINTSQAIIQPGTWYHVGFVRSGSSGNWTSTIYVNGAISTNTSGIATNPGTQASYSIGIRGTFIASPFDGVIDEVRVYNRSLNQDEIKRLYQMGR